MDAKHTDETWCIEDTLFYPLGLINHTTGTKTVFVTWNEKYLVSFILKKVAGSTRLNKFIINAPAEIVNIVILETNTLILLQNGEVYYFSSIKSIHEIPWLNRGVRAISSSNEGFALIRVLDDNRINLEIYDDISNIGKRTQSLLRTLDITFDDANIFNNDWHDESFTLISIEISNANRKFIEILVGESNLQTKEIFVFSVSNRIFAVYGAADDVEIKALPPQICCVQDLKCIQKNVLLVILECGIVEIWYLTKLSGTLEKHSYINGSEFVHHTFAEDMMYFTDEQRVCRVNFSYDSTDHTYQVMEQVIDAPGMVAITYEGLTGTLVCLSNNNIFYQLSFENMKTKVNDKTFKNDELFDIATEKGQEILNKSHRIGVLPKVLDNQIEAEYRKQELMAVHRKSAIYSDLIHAEISIVQHLPETCERLIYIGKKRDPINTIYAIISLRILPHEIFRSTPWKLMIAHSYNITLLSITEDLLQEKVNVLIPMERYVTEPIPEFDIQVLTYVNFAQDFVCINIPVEVRAPDFRKLFSHNQGLRRPSSKHDSEKFAFSITTSLSEINLFNSGLVMKIFGLPAPVVDEEDLDRVLNDTLFFLGNKVNFKFNEELKKLTITSSDPLAIYYAKICIAKFVWESFDRLPKDSERFLKPLLEIQCQVEKKYGALVDKQLHLVNLNRAYEQLRNVIGWTY